MDADVRGVRRLRRHMCMDLDMWLCVHMCMYLCMDRVWVCMGTLWACVGMSMCMGMCMWVSEGLMVCPP